jgi:hypothetical protein
VYVPSQDAIPTTNIACRAELVVEASQTLTTLDPCPPHRESFKEGNITRREKREKEK